ncbi:MAG: PEP-CTERM sorting domain-containing protein [Candidatus Didemnitutus sp.]|nr:PEP-CTERM sorting domain-containing protein [Candidatus Didemnitutus sp.]
MKSLRLFASVAAFSLLAHVGFGQVSITASGTYTQNFDTLISSSSATWTDNSTLANWYAQRSGTGTTIAADTGSGTGGNLYSYGSTSASDRALGSLGSGNAAAGHFAWGVTFQNNAAGTTTLGTLSYVGEQWRNSAAAAQSITVWYQLSSSNITSFTPNIDTGWTQLNGLTFTSPITGGSAGALNGNLSANRTSLSLDVSSITLTSGQYLAIRFSDVDHSGTDHGLAIDDFSLSYTAIPEPSTYAAIFGALALVGVIAHRRRQKHAA